MATRGNLFVDSAWLIHFLTFLCAIDFTSSPILFWPSMGQFGFVCTHTISSLIFRGQGGAWVWTRSHIIPTAADTPFPCYSPTWSRFAWGIPFMVPRGNFADPPRIFHCMEFSVLKILERTPHCSALFSFVFRCLDSSPSPPSPPLSHPSPMCKLSTC
jgi:hypothetical protein